MDSSTPRSRTGVHVQVKAAVASFIKE